MSQSRPARDPPAKRPPPTDQRPRTIGSIIGSDSFGSNEQIWILFVRVGLVPEAPVCKDCSGPLNVEKTKAKLHFSVM